MSMDETTNTDPAAPVAATSAAGSSTTPETPPAGTAERRFTSSEVESIVKERLARVKASTPTPAPTPPPAPAGKVTLESLQAELAETRLRGAFDKRTAKLSLPDDEVEDLFELYKGKSADVRDNWLDAKAKKSMPAPTTPSTTTNANAGIEAKPVAAPNTPGRVDPITSGGLVDIWNLTPQQLTDLGPSGLRAEFEKIQAAGSRAAGAPPRPKTPQR